MAEDIASSLAVPEGPLLRLLSDSGASSCATLPHNRKSSRQIGEAICCTALNARVESWFFKVRHPASLSNCKNLSVQNLRFLESPHVSGTIFLTDYYLNRNALSGPARDIGPAVQTREIKAPRLTNNHAVLTVIRWARAVAIVTAPFPAIPPLSVLPPVPAVIVAVISVSIISSIIDAGRIISARAVTAIVNASAQDADRQEADCCG